MIAYLKGYIKEKTDRSVLLLANGVGYHIFVTESLLAQTILEDEIEIYTHVHFSTRDETVMIYGFANSAEQRFFEQLIGVSGVGRRSALATLSVASFSELQQTIVQGDPVLLQKVSGIGKKTAERIVVELKDKLLSSIGSLDQTGVASAGNEVISALEGLGYSVSDIREVLRHLPAELESTEEKIKEALRLLAK